MTRTQMNHTKRRPEGGHEYSSWDAANAAVQEAVTQGRAQHGTVSGPKTGMGGAMVYTAHVSRGGTGRML